jgi:heme-degrading monooxygenase HmoA
MNTTSNSAVIEIVTLTLNDGVTAKQFAALDHDVQVEHVEKQPGFLSRESAPGPHKTWLIIVHWRTAEAAEASMASFSSAPAAAKFTQAIKPGTLSMTRYGDGI